jgi:hypothetical protein
MDIARGLKKHGRDVVDKPLLELMSKDVISIDIGESLSKVLGLMDQYQIYQIDTSRLIPNQGAGAARMRIEAVRRILPLPLSCEAMRGGVRGVGLVSRARRRSSRGWAWPVTRLVESCRGCIRTDGGQLQRSTV